MKTYNPMHRYQKDDAGNDGGGSEGKTYTQAEVDELVAGLKNKNGELLGSQKQLKADLATMQETTKTLRRHRPRSGTQHPQTLFRRRRSQADCRGQD